MLPCIRQNVSLLRTTRNSLRNVYPRLFTNVVTYEILHDYIHLIDYIGDTVSATYVFYLYMCDFARMPLRCVCPYIRSNMVKRYDQIYGTYGVSNMACGLKKSPH